MIVKDKYNIVANILGYEETKVIFEYVIGSNNLYLAFNNNLSNKDNAKIDSIVKRRKKGEPLQYPIGVWPFMDLDFIVGSGVLIPRDDTEVLVREADCIIKQHKLRNCIDLCSGTGIIGITLKYLNKDTNFVLVEKSSDAFEYLKQNVIKHKIDVNIINEDLIDYVNKIENNSLDLLVSNPPYIKKDEIKTLQTEISYEPVMALDGGDDGLDFYRLIINLYKNKIKQNGFIGFEIGEEQGNDVSSLLENDFEDIKIINDIQGLERAVFARKK